MKLSCVYCSLSYKTFKQKPICWPLKNYTSFVQIDEHWFEKKKQQQQPIEYKQNPVAQTQIQRSGLTIERHLFYSQYVNTFVVLSLCKQLGIEFGVLQSIKLNGNWMNEIWSNHYHTTSLKSLSLLQSRFALRDCDKLFLIFRVIFSIENWVMTSHQLHSSLKRKEKIQWIYSFKIVSFTFYRWIFKWKKKKQLPTKNSI